MSSEVFLVLLLVFTDLSSFTFTRYLNNFSLFSFKACLMGSIFSLFSEWYTFSTLLIPFVLTLDFHTFAATLKSVIHLHISQSFVSPFLCIGIFTPNFQSSFFPCHSKQFCWHFSPYCSHTF